MKYTRFITTLLTILSSTIFTLQAQDQATLRFTGQNQNGQHVTLSTVTVENVTQHWQEMLYYPDTVLFIGPVGIHDPQPEGKGVRLFQNVPNPFDGVTDFVLHLPEASAVTLEICDVNGSVTAAYTGSLDQGDNCFRAWLSSPQTYLLSARTEGGTVRIKMVNAGSAGQNRIEYLGKGETSPMAKSDDNAKGSTNLPFSFGDWMLYKGYANLAGTEFESVSVERQQYGSELITLTFSLPLPTVTTEAATDISATEAKLNGIVEEYAGYPIVERGFLFADNASLDGAVEHMAGSGAGLFYCVIANLQIATRYYFRAYAKTEIGTTYGDVLFLDTQAEMPTVLTLDVMDVKASKATVTGNVTATGGAYVTHRGVCWSTAQNPTLNDSHTDDGNGLGVFTSHITGLTPDTTYYVRAYATNSVGTAYGDQRSFTTTSPFFCGFDTVTDYDGNVYHTVEIGQQCWITENLRTTHYADGTIIPIGTELSENTAYRYYPSGSSVNVPAYGYLYNWAAVMHGAASSSENPSGVQGICPPGWHVPSEAEFAQLTTYVAGQGQYGCGGDTSNIIRALASNIGWECLGVSSCNADYNQFLNNATGFSAVPAGNAGYEMCQFGFPDFRSSCKIRSSTEHFGYDGPHGAATLEITYDGINIHPYIVCYATSVRCLLDDSGVGSSNAVTPLVTTAQTEYITSTSAKFKGFVTASGGTPVTGRGFCWSTAPNPTVSDNHTVNGSGTGRFTENLAGLTPGTTYYMRAYATNSVGTAYGEQQSFTTCDSLICDSTLTDYDGNIYHTVVIGQQCWMRENLRTTHLPNGTAIPVGTTVYYEPYRFIPNNDSSLVSSYGYLYNKYAVMNGCSPSNTNPSGVQGICPTGWHVPSKAEWEQLVHFLGSRVEYRCGCGSNDIAQSLAATSGWQQSIDPCSTGFDVNANNSTGFSALPAGYYSYGPHGTNEFSLFWSSTIKSNNSDIYYRIQIEKSGRGVYMGEILFDAVSVRCLRDDSSAIVIPSVTTDTLSAISISSATCGGFVSGSGGSYVTARGVCWSILPDPTTDDSHTTDGSGNGSFTSTITGLLPSTTYHVRAYATNIAGTAYGEELTFTTWPAFYCGIDSATDYDDNHYPTVEIGSQCWMKENLRTTHFPDGAIIPDGSDAAPSMYNPYRYFPSADSLNTPILGYLYNWPAVMHNATSSNTTEWSGVQGICPLGWHVPSKAEFDQLINYLSSQPQYVCGEDNSNVAKALAATTGWQSSNFYCAVGTYPQANNATGFTAYPLGYYLDGIYVDATTMAPFWSATQIVLDGNYGAYYLRIQVHDPNLITTGLLQRLGLPVRCLRD